MTIDEEIRELEAEIDNINDSYTNDIIKLKNEGKLSVSDEKKNEIFKEVALKYADTLIEKQERLEKLMLKKTRGI